MKALSVRQPWAWAILHAGKTVENRSYPTGYRGLVAVHASAQPDRDGDVKLLAILGRYAGDVLDFGSLLGTVRVIGCVQDADTYSKWAERGAWHWLLADPVAFAEPIPCKGRLGLWTVPEGLVAA